MMFVDLIYTRHDNPLPDDLAVVDRGLEESNFARAPLDEVRPLACFARLPTGEVIGGVVGRSWGHCCEIQQVYVHPGYRRRGVAARLVQEFETHAGRRGCQIVFLETFSFQAPELYRSLGYHIVHTNNCYPHGISKLVMERTISPDDDRN